MYDPSYAAFAIGSGIMMKFKSKDHRSLFKIENLVLLASGS